MVRSKSIAWLFKCTYVISDIIDTVYNTCADDYCSESAIVMKFNRTARIGIKTAIPTHNRCRFVTIKLNMHPSYFNCVSFTLSIEIASIRPNSNLLDAFHSTKRRKLASVVGNNVSKLIALFCLQIFYASYYSAY